MAVVYRCPECRQKFRWDLSKGEPTKCHAERPCGYEYRDVEHDEAGNEIIAMPAFLSDKTKRNDAVARQTMDASEMRVQHAAAMAGCDASDMSNLKVTNLTDDPKAQYAVPEVNNAVTQMMAAMPANTVGHIGQMGLSYAAGAMVGDSPNAGARNQRALRNLHAQTVIETVRGKDETGRVVGPSTTPSFDNPSIEFKDPARGYRPRI